MATPVYIFENGTVTPAIAGATSGGRYVFIDSIELEREREQEIERMKKDVLSWLPDPYTLEMPKGVPIINQARVGRNDACPCGSGKKFKRCCKKG
jgi:preprotein translocase subunit SecA